MFSSRRPWSALLTGALTFALTGCPGEQPAKTGDTTGPGSGEASAALSTDEVKKLQEMASGMFGPVPAVAEAAGNELTPAKVDLGRMLYFETRLSKAQDISCNSCHDLAKFGVDGEKTSPGHEGQRGTRNSPTVYNAAFHSSQFWDGRAATVEEQATMPITNPVEMAMADDAAVETVLRSIPGYGAKFGEAFPGQEQPVTMANVGQAIGAFERGLTTQNAPFDRFLAGETAALSPAAQRGLKAFVDVGCIQCHMGPQLGGNLFQKLGLRKPWPNLGDDTGRAEVTDNAMEKYFFKVPGLRNVAQTAPYLHDGSVADLGEVSRMMAEYQLGQQLTDAQVADMVAFLESLTGELPAEYVQKPDLPESGPDTPAAQQD